MLAPLSSIAGYTHFLYLSAGARIMKIIKTDEDIYQCNKQATHLVSVATVWIPRRRSHFFLVSKATGNVYPVPRRARSQVTGSGAEAKKDHTIQRPWYVVATNPRPASTAFAHAAHPANAVARIDNLEFLSDVIPQVHAIKQTRETKPAKSKKQATTMTGQTTLNVLLKTKPDRVSATPEAETDGKPEQPQKSSNPKDKGKGREAEQPESPRVADEDEDVIME
jgi:hypothetical protein